uniref:Glypican-6 n=1 Tax=Schizaphis graminum TaxID=13262 RepID=A0A2S2N7R1_SCHGA
MNGFYLIFSNYINLKITLNIITYTITIVFKCVLCINLSPQLLFMCIHIYYTIYFLLDFWGLLLILYLKVEYSYVFMTPFDYFIRRYLVCVSESMSEVAPFGDVPDKLSAPLKRSFVASRTYVQALKIASDILANINKMAPTQECLVGFTRMTQCPACRGLQDSKACNGYCLNVMKGCLAYHSQLDQDWNAFLDIMEKVKKRLLGPFNIELVVIPINVKISEGIMNFQENSQKVSQKVKDHFYYLPIVTRIVSKIKNNRSH